MIIILISSLELVNNYTPRIENEFISIIQFFSIFVTSFYFAHLIGMAKARVIFTEEFFIHVWERKFLFSWEKNLKIPWNIVDNYVFQEDRTFDSFIINLTNKTRYKINRINVFPIKDDFKSFHRDFKRLSNEYRKGVVPENDKLMIKEGESIYASKSFKLIFYFLSVGYLVLVFTKVFNSESETTWSSLGVIGSGLLFYWAMMKGQKKTTNANKS